MHMKFLASFAKKRTKATLGTRFQAPGDDSQYDQEESRLGGLTHRVTVDESKVIEGHPLLLILPNELLLEIIQHRRTNRINEYIAPGLDQKNCRLVSRLFRDVTTRTLFSHMRFSLSPPRNYSYCPDHGFWFVGASSKRAGGCQVCSDSPSTPVTLNPFTDPIVDYLSNDSDLVRLIPLARSLRIEVLSVALPKWVSFERELASFTSEALPLVLRSAKRLRIVHLNASLDQSLSQTLPFFLSSVCDLCYERPENVDLHVSLRVSHFLGLTEALGGLRCITSLEVKGADKQRETKEKIQELLDNVVRNSPKLRISPDQVATVSSQRL